ncbi:Sodium/hydrogen exchanger family [Nesidiocoris tenuis]|uniref:Sodium/hydrogen exchanger family n=1 Tax=Nesidiocoris tenuis TaxID=355587 RepID=A0ABN7A8R5_9HEMI|nr:Sodium/hydrogen exchanger family [Nesidiocoris tenuis]
MTLAAVEEPLFVDLGAVTITSRAQNNTDHEERSTKKRVRNVKFFRAASKLLTTVIYSAITFLTLVILSHRLEIDPMIPGLFVALILASYLSGQVCLRLGLPQVVPMYLIGSGFRTFGIYDDFVNWTVFANLRYLAVTVILVKSGLAMNIDVAKNYKSQVLKSSFVISTVEAMALMIAASLFLPGIFPSVWAFVFGFVNSPTSPTKFASMLSLLKAKKKYSNKKLQEIWSFSAPVEIIYCISVFSVLMSLAVGTNGKNKMLILIRGIGCVGLGFVAGAVWGLVVGYLPRKDDINLTAKRFFGLWMGVTAIYFGAKSYGWGPGGPLGTFVGGICANTTWTYLNRTNKKSVLNYFNKLWDWIMEPLLFALVGYEISMTDLPMSASEISIAAGCLTFGVLVRCLISIAIHYTCGFSYREIAFLTISGIPKATVQAAISPQLLDLVRGTDSETRAKALVLTSIMATLIFTTLSTSFLHFFSRRLLKGTEKPLSEQSACKI